MTNPTGDRAKTLAVIVFNSKARNRMMKWRASYFKGLYFRKSFIGGRVAEAAALQCLLILFVLLTTSTRLYSQDALSLTRIAITVSKSDLSPTPPPLLVQELPYCELGYGACGGQCSEDEGKKRWNCPAEALVCYHEGQHCTCEAADMCKPKKKKAEPRTEPGR